MGHAQVSCEGTGIVRHRIPAPGNADPKEYNDDQGNAHDYALNQVRGGDSHESAQDLSLIHIYLFEADVQFHMAIVGITENVMLQSICNYVDKITRRSRMATIDQIFEAGEAENFLDMHRRIVKLLQDRDAAGIYATVEEHYQYLSLIHI